MKLSILVPYIRKHEAFFYKLQFNLFSKMLPYANDVELLSDNHEYDSIGMKRNRLLERSKGGYVLFVDSDDRVAPDYIKSLMEGIEKGVDCCSLRGVITTDGKSPFLFEHSIKYDKYETVNDAKFEREEITYLRYPNHLNCINADIAKQFKFPETNWGEDTDWATQIHNSELLKTEHYIPDVIYYYDYISNKK